MNLSTPPPPVANQMMLHFGFVMLNWQWQTERLNWAIVIESVKQIYYADITKQESAKVVFWKIRCLLRKVFLGAE